MIADMNLKETASAGTTQWNITESVPYMIHNRWKQDSPYNTACPYVGASKKKQAPVGCGPLAIGAIATYHGYPHLDSIDGTPFSYEKIRTIAPDEKTWQTGDAEAQKGLAAFLAHLGTLCNTHYFSFGGTAYGLTLPGSASECMEKLGYKDVKLTRRFDEEMILTSLRDGCPVIAIAFSSLTSAHIFVIDGFMIRERVSQDGKTKETQTLLHLNLGAAGVSDGYYLPKVFNTASPVINDNIVNFTSSKNYKFGFRIITYKNPNKR